MIINWKQKVFIKGITIIPVGCQRFLLQRDRRGSLHRKERGPVKVQTVVQQHVALFHGRQRDAHHGRRRLLLRDRGRGQRHRRNWSTLLLLRLLLLLVHGRLWHVRRDVLIFLTAVTCANERQHNGKISWLLSCPG